MPIKIEDLRSFFDRHPEYAGVRGETEKMAQGSSAPDGTINSAAIDWIFTDETLAKQFVAELICLKI